MRLFLLLVTLALFQEYDQADVSNFPAKLGSPTKNYPPGRTPSPKVISIQYEKRNGLSSQSPTPEKAQTTYKPPRGQQKYTNSPLIVVSSDKRDGYSAEVEKKASQNYKREFQPQPAQYALSPDPKQYLPQRMPQQYSQNYQNAIPRGTPDAVTGVMPDFVSRQSDYRAINEIPQSQGGYYPQIRPQPENYAIDDGQTYMQSSPQEAQQNPQQNYHGVSPDVRQGYMYPSIQGQQLPNQQIFQGMNQDGRQNYQQDSRQEYAQPSWTGQQQTPSTYQPVNGMPGSGVISISLPGNDEVLQPKGGYNSQRKPQQFVDGYQVVNEGPVEYVVSELNPGASINSRQSQQKLPLSYAPNDNPTGNYMPVQSSYYPSQGSQDSVQSYRSNDEYTQYPSSYISQDQQREVPYGTWKPEQPSMQIPMSYFDGSKDSQQKLMDMITSQISRHARKTQ